MRGTGIRQTVCLELYCLTVTDDVHNKTKIFSTIKISRICHEGDLVI